MAETDLCRYYGYSLPKGADSVAASAGLTDLNTMFDQFDTKLDQLDLQASVPAPDEPFCAVWTSSANQVISSSATPINPTYTWVNTFTGAGTIAPTFNTSTGFITFPTGGFYRLTYHAQVDDAPSVTEGYACSGLKETGTAAFVTRTAKYVPMETYMGKISVYKSVLLRAASSGNADVNLTSSYALATIQENNLASTMTVKTGLTWLALEYVRSL